MTPDDRVAFAELMLGLGETFGEPITDARMEIYFAALADLDLAQIRVSATAHVRLSKFFPRPAELRAGIDGSSEERSDLAWAHLVTEVRRVGPYPRWNSKAATMEPPAPKFFDAAAERAALELFGGWGALCELLPGEGPALLGTAKLFKATYRAYAERAARGALPAVETRELGRGVAAAALSSLTRELKERGL